LRGYLDQFETDFIVEIERIISTLEAIQYPTGPSRYYALDLIVCLKAGALAGSMIIASALLEIYVRGLVVRYTEIAQTNWSRKVDAEIELEAMRNMNFQRLIDHLVQASLFAVEDSELAKTIYKDVRIPTHHGLPARLLGIGKEDFFTSAMTLGLGTSAVTMREFETFVEEEALNVLRDITGILERNQFQRTS
jgi:hypothetical protein